MTDFDKTIQWLHSVGVGYKVVKPDCTENEVYSNKLLENPPIQFEQLCTPVVNIKISGWSHYKKVDCYPSFYNLLKFDASGGLVEFGIWE